MIKHIVFWKIKNAAHGKSKDEVSRGIRDKLISLPSKIPEIIDFEVGFNFNPSAAAYEIALYSTFESVEDLETYQAHPAHVEVKDYIVAAAEQTAVVDYEI